MTKLTKIAAMTLVALTLSMVFVGVNTNAMPHEEPDDIVWAIPHEGAEEIVVVEKRESFGHVCNMVVVDSQWGNCAEGGFVKQECTVCGCGETTFFDAHAHKINVLEGPLGVIYTCDNCDAIAFSEGYIHLD